MKITPFRALLIALVVMIAVAWMPSPPAHGTLQAQQRPASSSPIWVYRVDPVPFGGAESIEQLLNQRGGEGWELVAVGTTNLYLKRPR